VDLGDRHNIAGDVVQAFRLMAITSNRCGRSTGASTGFIESLLICGLPSMSNCKLARLSIILSASRSIDLAKVALSIMAKNKIFTQIERLKSFVSPEEAWILLLCLPEILVTTTNRFVLLSGQ